MKQRGSLPICCWAAEDIPTNRAETNGYKSLTNAELISIIIGSGSKDLNAIELSRVILSHCGNNLKSLLRLRQEDLTAINGLGRQKVSKIYAALELGLRMIEMQTEEKPDLGTATRLYRHYVGRIGNLDEEEFWVSFMNQGYRLIKDYRVSRGGLTETAVDIRIIMREAVLCNATVIACVHNHPSGRLSPSNADDNLTRDIKRACEFMKIYFADHVIVTDGNYYSYHEQGRL